MGSVANKTVIDPYFRTNWEEGTGPNSASFKEGLAAGKRWMERGYSWNELIESVKDEYYLNSDEASVLNDKLKMYAIQHDEYSNLHNSWKEDFEKRGIKITGRRTKLEIDLDRRTK